MAGSSTADTSIAAAAAAATATASAAVSIPPAAVFYFDLGSPEAYLVAERLAHVLGPAGLAVQWQPVLAHELGGDRRSGGDLDRALHPQREPNLDREPNFDIDPDLRRLDAAEIEARAARQGLMPIRWPTEFPFDSEHAMLVATYAKSIGRGVPFAQAAFRQAFAGGRSLALPDNVVIAAAACEMHPNAVLRGARLTSVADQLRAATAVASDIGVSYVPAVQVGVRVFSGESAPERAMSASAATATEAL